MTKEYQDEVKETKREKRRLDDLLTIRENEIEGLKSQLKNQEIQVA